MPALKHPAIANSLLACLPRIEYQRLAAGFETVVLTFGEVLYEPGEPIQHVYFPSTSLVSLLTLADGRLALEIGMVGSEGMVGISLALEVGVSPVRALVQGAGPAMRMKSARFLKEFRQSQAWQRAFIAMPIHSWPRSHRPPPATVFTWLQARVARWLLMTRDRVRSNDIHLTQEFLASMLGVQRVGMSKAAGQLQKRKLIEYSRGRIRIVDRRGLEAASCSCYQIVRNIRS